MATWFDAHLDLAYLAVNGRDMLAPLNPAAGPHPPASVTLPALAGARVRMALGTIFTEPIDHAAAKPGPETYPAGDTERAFVVARAQLEAYLTWQDRGAVALDLAQALAIDPGVGEIRGGMGVAEVVPLSVGQRLARLSRSPALHLGVLMENADPIRSPADVKWWKDRGVIAVGLTWAKSSRYAGGNADPDRGKGLTPQGRELVQELDRHRILHDASHLADAAFRDLCECTERRIVASHSNCRAITDPSGANQRHLTDAQIKEIIRRGGVIGLNLLGSFLAPAHSEAAPRPTIEQALAHVDHICALAGNTRHVGLGSDMDGGFTADRLPQGINTPGDFALLGEGLRKKGWSDADVEAFACGNWMRVIGMLNQ